MNAWFLWGKLKGQGSLWYKEETIMMSIVEKDVEQGSLIISGVVETCSI